ncbi:MAG: agmatine deiminase family protein [Myxococcales bacterium]|nr:agmatine deiminase family protein [Myxococcales bacterium]MCB9707445.1 agmatine deiminase family protein [Myxococcales bacterium]
MALDAPQPFFGEGTFRKPAEWEPHKAVWVAWPWDERDWQQDLPGAQNELIQLCSAILNLDESGRRRGELIAMLVRDEDDQHYIEAKLGPSAAHTRFHFIPSGDLWLRDTAPLFVKSQTGLEAAACFEFNGWGGKYLYPDDAHVARRIARASGVTRMDVPLVLEGGGLEFDGKGTCLTTRQCLLHPKRNPHRTQADIEDILQRALGVSKILWLEEGLLNDHTDGHIDNLARFVAEGTVLCMTPDPQGDPNRAVLLDIHNHLQSARDAAGRTLRVVTLPSPGFVARDDGSPYPASYLNFYIANSTVVVPAFGKPADREAQAVLATLFPSRRVISLGARSLLTGGGTFHCITQQQ